jgi:hypothetical protein
MPKRKVKSPAVPLLVDEYFRCSPRVAKQFALLVLGRKRAKRKIKPKFVISYGIADKGKFLSAPIPRVKPMSCTRYCNGKLVRISQA